MRFLKLVLLFVLFLLIAADSFSNVIVITKNGGEYEGMVVEKTKDILRLETLDGHRINIPRKSIAEIEKIEETFITKTGEEYTGSVIKKDEEFIELKTEDGAVLKLRKSSLDLRTREERLDDGYPMAGLTLFLPGGINALFGYNIGDWSFRGEFGMLPPVIVGIQINAAFNIIKTVHFENNISLGGGFIHLEDYIDYDHYGYIGLFNDMNVYGFFIEGGLSVGSGDYESPQLHFQFGYVYRFND